MSPALLAALLLCAQQPDPQPVPPPETETPVPDAQTQEPDSAEPQGEDGERDTVTMEEVQDAIARVSDRLADATAKLEDAVARASDEGEGGDVALSEALAEHQRLMTEMEHLLAILPEPPPPPPDSGGGGGSGGVQPRPRPDRPLPQNEDEGPLDRPERGGDEDPEGQGERLDSARGMFLDELRQGSWGQLPPRLQQSIDAAAVADVPLRYRRWLVEYHRRATEPR